MKFCPSCHAEFLPDIEKCAICDQILVSELEIKPGALNADKAAMLEDELIPILESGIAQCREVEKFLAQAMVPTVVYPVSLASNISNETLGSAREMKYMVLIRPEDLDKAKLAMEGHFLAAVEKEGKGQGQNVVIDLDQSEVTCPACQETGPLNNGECGTCGLVLSLPEKPS